jgi:hypothetical protein
VNEDIRTDFLLESLKGIKITIRIKCIWDDDIKIGIMDTSSKCGMARSDSVARALINTVKIFCSIKHGKDLDQMTDYYFVTKNPTELRGRIVNTPASYLGRPWFKSLPEYRQS